MFQWMTVNEIGMVKWIRRSLMMLWVLGSNLLSSLQILLLYPGAMTQPDPMTPLTVDTSRDQGWVNKESFESL